MEGLNVRMLMSRFGGGGAVTLPVLALVVSAHQDSGYNVATAAGSLAVATRIVLTINPGVRIKVLTTGTFPSGSQIRIINKGVIHGPGGDGGSGMTNGNGTNGGNALVLSSSSGLGLFEIDNGAGYILGGGGGGKGASGAGGGGGAGSGNGGAAGPVNGEGQDGYRPQWTGASWNRLSDAGGAGGPQVIGGLTFGRLGQDGRDWGETGLSGDGSPGKAIELNGGASPTWLAGNSAERVKGAVS